MSQRQGASPAKRETGFTLIELVTTIAVVAILLAIASPFVAGMIRNAELRGAARIVASTMQRARSEAITRKINVGVEFTTTAGAAIMGGSFRVYLDSDDDGVCDVGETVLEQTNVAPSVALYGSTFATGSARYDSRGLANGAGSIRLANATPLFYRISVSTTGNVRIQKASTEGAI